jgi:hypothetical protein
MFNCDATCEIFISSASSVMSTLKHNSVMLNLIQHLPVNQNIPIRQALSAYQRMADRNDETDSLCLT